MPRAIPLTGLRVVEVVDGLDVEDEVVLVVLELVPEYEVLGVLPRPLRTTRPRVVVPRVVREPAASALFR